MQRFVRLLDNATYMPLEHIQKEKEYGIPWRSSFKEELLEFVGQAQAKFVGLDGRMEVIDDPFMFFHKIVKKDALDAATFDQQSQADFMSMMMENLEILEQWVY